MLANTINQLHDLAWRYGGELSDLWRPEIQGLARGEYPFAPSLTRGAAEADVARLAPLREMFLDIARHPRQDDLAKYFQDQYQREVGGRLGAFGLLGQGRGADIANKADLDFFMSLLANADARRAYGTQNADAITQALLGRDVTRQQARGTSLDLADRLNRAELATRNFAIPGYQSLLSADQAREFMRNQMVQAGESPWQTGIGAIGDVLGIVGSIYGMSKGTPPMGNVGQNPQTGTVTAPYSGPYGSGGTYGLYNYGGVNAPPMTPWGTPVSGYSFDGSPSYGPAYGGGYSLSGGDMGYGGPLSRTGNTRYIYGARGGVVPGRGRSDTIPAMLTPGEFVVRRSAVRRHLPELKRINRRAGDQVHA